jgi:hypothetical protein
MSAQPEKPGITFDCSVPDRTPEITSSRVRDEYNRKINSRQFKRIFLNNFVLKKNVAKACKQTGITRGQFNRWIKNDPQFKRDYNDLVEALTDLLLEKAILRASKGTERHKFFKGEMIIDPRTGKPYVEREYSDSLLMFLLKGLRPDTFGDKNQVEVKTTSQSQFEKEALGKLSDEEIEQLERIMTKIGQPAGDTEGEGSATYLEFHQVDDARVSPELASQLARDEV